MTKGRLAYLLLAVIGTALLIPSAAAAASRAQITTYSEWNARVDAVMHSALTLTGRSDKLDQLTRDVAAGRQDPQQARLLGAAIISDLRTRLAEIRGEARDLPPPPVMPDQAKNKASQSKRLYAEKLIGNVANLLETSIAIFEQAMAGDTKIDKPLYLKFSHQMIIRLEAANITNRAAIASQPTEPLHPQYHLLSCIVETNESMIAIWRAIIDVSHGQDAARIHARMQRRIIRADGRVKVLVHRGQEQVKVYRQLFSEGRARGQYPKAQVDLLNRMMDTYDQAYEVEQQIADALLAYANLPNMADQNETHRRKAEAILGTIGPLAEKRGQLQARRTRMASQL